MAEEAKIEEGENATNPEELKAQFAVPAVLANKSYVTLNPSGVILTFSENIAADVMPQPRARVILPFQDAVALSALLERMLTPIREALEKAPAISVTVEKSKNG